MNVIIGIPTTSAIDARSVMIICLIIAWSKYTARNARGLAVYNAIVIIMAIETIFFVARNAVTVIVETKTITSTANNAIFVLMLIEIKIVFIARNAVSVIMKLKMITSTARNVKSGFMAKKKNFITVTNA